VIFAAAFLAAAAVVAAFDASAWAQSEDELRGPQRKAQFPPKFGATPRNVGAFEPTYSTLPGSGAGKTGFVSQRKAPKKKAVPVSRKSNVDAKTAARNPSIARADALLAPEANAARRPRRRAAEEEPYAPTGFRAGAFLLRPSIALQAGYESNASRTPVATASPFQAVTGQLQAVSQWSRHELSLDLRGAYTTYSDLEGLDRPEISATLRGRIDVTSLSRIELESRFSLTTEDPGSPDAVAAVARQPNVYAFGASAAYVQRFNRFEILGGLGIERYLYDNAELTNGVIVSLADRDYQAYTARLRASYEWTPDVKPFVEIGFDQRERDLPVDFNGIRRDSAGNTIRAGITFGRQERLSGEVSAGWAQRRYEDPSLNDISGLIFDSSLVWRATGLTTFRLTARSGIDETQVTGASGILRREVRLSADHAFRRWLIATAAIGYTWEDYRGAGLVNDYLRSSVALTYFLNRSIALRAEYRNEQRFSNVAGQDYTANIGLIGLRLQR
jgi:hypothetical protein